MRRAAIALSLVLIACSGSQTTPPTASPTTTTAVGSKRITVYSGRSEKLVKPVFEQFTKATGIEVAARYGESAELAAQIAEEGPNSPADVFFSQDAGALGALAKRKLLGPLSGTVLDRVERRFRSPEGVWVGVSGRARVIVYNKEKLTATEVPTSVFDLVDSRWKGRIGIAPTNASFQSFVTAMRVVSGEQKTREWLGALRANEPKMYEKNGLIVQAVHEGAVDLGLVNHYYLYELGAEIGRDKVRAQNSFPTGGDPGALVNVAAVGRLASSHAPNEATAFIEFLLGAVAQAYFAEKTFEYPLVAGVPADPALPKLGDIESPNIDLSDLDTLEETLRLLKEVGLL